MNIRKFFRAAIRSLFGEYEDLSSPIYYFGGSSESGITVTNDTAMNLSSVWACTQILSQTIASLPLVLYKKVKGGKSIAEDHLLHNVLHFLPNNEMTSYEFVQLILVNLCQWGNFYAEIQRNNAGEVIALWPLPPNKVTVVRNKKDRKIYYMVKINNVERTALSIGQVFHVKGLSSDGLVGLSPVVAGAEAIGLGLASQSSASKFYSNGSVPSGVLKHPGQLSDDAYKRIVNSWENIHKGLQNKHRVALLEENMDFTPITISPEQAQLLGSRKFSIEEIARYYRMPLHKLQNLDRATNNNIEQQSIDFLTDTILPWLVNIERVISWKLIFEDERNVLYPKFIVDGLLRGDTVSRYSAYGMALDKGWMSIDEVREKENMNALPDGLGKSYRVPLNTVEIGRSPNDQSKFIGKKALQENKNGN